MKYFLWMWEESCKYDVRAVGPSDNTKTDLWRQRWSSTLQHRNRFCHDSHFGGGEPTRAVLLYASSTFSWILSLASGCSCIFLWRLPVGCTRVFRRLGRIFSTWRVRCSCSHFKLVGAFPCEMPNAMEFLTAHRCMCLRVSATRDLWLASAVRFTIPLGSRVSVRELAGWRWCFFLSAFGLLTANTFVLTHVIGYKNVH